MSILITGGAGYIGSHTVKYLQQQGREVIVVDNIQSGHRESVDVEHFYQMDIRDEGRLVEILHKHHVDCVIHFAANSLVGESMEKPFEYYHNNVYGMLCLLNAMRRAGVDRIVFSSTAAVYGEPEKVPIKEHDRTLPGNTYGETKLAMERMMKWFDNAYGIRYVALRYFNATGACEDGSIGESHSPETHLIPLVLQVPAGQREKIFVFGDDYDTEDGTCVRDYIHVWDLAQAHYLAAEYLAEGGKSDVFNLGTGKGLSVREIIDMARCVTGHDIPEVMAERRSGDPAVLIASSEKARSVLGWKPQFENVGKIIETAWRWQRNKRY